VGLVVDGVDMASQLGEDGDFKVLIFKVNRPVTLRLSPIGQIIKHRIGIDRMGIGQGKWRIRIRWSELIGGNRDRAFPCVHRLCVRRAKYQQKAKQESGDACVAASADVTGPTTAVHFPQGRS
jgi:hypothetical protein